MTKVNICKKVILLLSLWVIGLMNPGVGFDAMPASRGELCEYQINESTNTVSYELGHASTLYPQDVESLIKKGYEKLSDISLGNDRANSHDLTIFRNYNRHNPYYFKNGVTLTNFLEWMGGYIYLSSSAATDEKIQARVETFVSIIWALVQLSWQRGDKFNRGAIIIQDKDKKIHDYLERLVLFCAHVEQPSDLNNGIYTIWGSNIGYNRLGQSSHFSGRQLTHYGFDARFESKSFALPVLPFGKEHVLFGRGITHRGEEVTFIKPEEAGVADFWSLWRHTYCFFAPIPPGTLLRREKDVPPKIATEIYVLMKRMHTHRRIFPCFNHNEKIQHIYQKIETGDLDGLYFETTKAYDISWFMMILSQIAHKGDVPDDIQTQINTIKELLISEFDEKSLFLRSGNEVLLLDREW
ncbi:hypothetical protein [Candidatus Odyssella acanthamoebae]|uniref:Uncharacterized protein n=1 Tax=Candidatus Odyssella acanthamoebae TaxID=91604 RepID=A0A077AYD0_9PROT|nr:hypothetical protein [Candidatus Paracaedibacter acanthamoebae]AIK96643.1 hypothetical protein ID47_07810 [Candidatus Paracaedibacter acanthamoebae]